MNAHVSPATVLAARDALANSIAGEADISYDDCFTIAEWLISNGVVAQEYFDKLDKPKRPEHTLITEPARIVPGYTFPGYGSIYQVSAAIGLD